MFTPIHWTDRQSSGGRTGLLPRALVDPHSGQPGFKATPARIEPVALEWRGFLIARASAGRLPGGTVGYAGHGGRQGWLVELAGRAIPPRWPSVACRAASGSRPAIQRAAASRMAVLDRMAG